ncbi:MAG: transposase family protein [Pirellulales bacterium]|nr:transposase family protein [Pirellulales bacterium]
MDRIGQTDAVSIREYFVDLKDPQSAVNRRHLLGDMMVICVLAVLAGADGPRAIATWATARKEWLREHLELPGGIPSHDTLGRLLALPRPEAFQRCFQQWIAYRRLTAEAVAVVRANRLPESKDYGLAFGLGAASVFGGLVAG